MDGYEFSSGQLEARKAYSQLGMVYAVFSLVSIGAQFAAIGILSLIDPVRSGTMEAQIFCSSFTLYAAGLLILTSGFKQTTLVKTVPEKHKMSFKSFLKAACMCYSLLIISNLLGTVITGIIGAIKGSPIVNPVEELVLSMDLPFLFLVTVVLAPIFEELFFRKYMIDRLLVYGEFVAIVISGFMFGLFHGNLSQFPYAFAIGAFFGFIYVRTGKLIYSVLLHAFINFMGSIVSVVLLNYVDLDMYANILSSSDIEKLLQTLTWEGLTGFVVLMVYEVFILVLVIIGIIFWILEAKKFITKIQDKELPVSRRFEVAICNPGILFYTGIWIIMIIIATIRG